MMFCEKYSDSNYIESDGCHSVIIAKDKGSSCVWRGLNKATRRVIKYRVDNGIITSKDEAKCDCAVYVDNNSVYFIELKGADYGHALKQIDNTVDKLIISQSIETSSVNGRIVLTKGKVPKLRYSVETALIKKLKRLNGTLLSKTRLFEEEL